MKTLFFECSMGASGDMLLGALLELIDSKEAFLRRLNGLGIPGLFVTCREEISRGIRGTKADVSVRGKMEHSHDDSSGHHHSHGHEHGEHAHEHEEHGHEHDDHVHTDDQGEGMDFSRIKTLISSLDLPEKVISDAVGVYTLIAGAEAKIHGAKTPESVHFHELGALDAVADIVGVCMLIDEIGPDVIISSPLHVGYGTVRTAHGQLPVPAPATAEILRGIETYGGDVRGELTTPTGAALIKHFAVEIQNAPDMAVSKIGYGLGSKDFGRPNCLRAFLGEGGAGSGGKIAELSCNLDDMTPEALGRAMEVLFEAGALDVFFTPIQMKKNRPGTMLTTLVKKEDSRKFSELILLHTSTAGVRINTLSRAILDTRFIDLSTPWGNVKIKLAEGYGILKYKPEYSDVAAAAQRSGLTFLEVQRFCEVEAARLLAEEK